MDRLTIAERSENMRRIRGKNTGPERQVRALARALGLHGYRLNRKDLPGKPDLAWIGKKKAIFVHGCFWHGHHCRHGARVPKSNTGYWLDKIQRNRARDRAHIAKLRRSGWRVIVIWECELRRQEKVAARILRLFQDCK